MPYDRKIKVPPEDLLLRTFNGDTYAVEDLLAFYDSYINKAASISVYSTHGQREGTFVSDDLKQDIICRILHSIPILKQKLFRDKQINESCIIILKK